ncbi:hypothetical protein BO82DRAFT_401304 [Aspergillus uvarum CBS 121591]|uniref:Uncharacterized protein n=1 Tax=Aspergillus uvarum CBS 121591 TaxID=1448315 RepID=A0A319CG07_9EURO|nr:hypothetical protein BO82DRAFT_401304 [Aspergillus uvarum CBS 121591]PYH82661.1 hypothetical protein BO82DRAFT_401304 [Aspergillus uvarum CBS 121591]
MYVDIPRLLLMVWAIVQPAVVAQDFPCSAQNCYKNCVAESDACLEDCREEAARIRNQRQAGIFWRRCRWGCDREIANCFSKDCKDLCPPKLEATYDICSNDCLQSALAGLDRCAQNRRPLDFCVPNNNEVFKDCEETCSKLYPTEQPTQAPATATTAPAATANPPPPPPPPPTDATDGSFERCGTIDRYLEASGVCLGPCLFNLCLNEQKCSGVTEEAANRQCASDGIKAYESCVHACQS